MTHGTQSSDRTAGATPASHLRDADTYHRWSSTNSLTAIGVRVVEVETDASRAARRRIKGRFIKGPIPLADVAAASRMPGHALAVLLAVHHMAALTRGARVRLPPSLLRQLGVSKGAKARALHQLEAAGLVNVDRRNGRAAVVTLSAPKERHMTDQRMPDADESPPIQIGDWLVTADGLESRVTAGPDNVVVDYFIDRDRLLKSHRSDAGVSDWAMQLSAKSWIRTPVANANMVEAVTTAIERHHPGQNVIDVAKTRAAAEREWRRTHGGASDDTYEYDLATGTLVPLGLDTDESDAAARGAEQKEES